MTLLLVMAGAAVGALLRYLTDTSIQSRHDSLFPWGTLSVNVVGSLVLGVLTGAVGARVVPPSMLPLLGVGLCGGLTTYSTFSYETMRLVEEDALFFAFLNAVVSVVAGVAAAFAGVALSQALW